MPDARCGISEAPCPNGAVQQLPRVLPHGTRQELEVQAGMRGQVGECLAERDRYVEYGLLPQASFMVVRAVSHAYGLLHNYGLLHSTGYFTCVFRNSIAAQVAVQLADAARLREHTKFRVDGNSP